MKRAHLVILAAALLPLLAAADADDFARTVAALNAGAVATTQATRARAGRSLLASAARPLDGNDVGKNWAGISTTRYRDRALGPGYRTVAVAPGQTAHFEQTFLAGQRAQIAIVALDRARFTLAVKDDEGAMFCATPLSGRCSWMPLWTTRYGIDVGNPGRETGRYYVVVQ